MVDLPARKWRDALAFKEDLWNELHISQSTRINFLQTRQYCTSLELLQRHILFIIVNYELFAKN